MYRIGMFTGNLYSQEEYDKNEVHECSICLSPTLEYDEAYKQAKEFQKACSITKCTGCYSCEEAKGFRQICDIMSKN